MPLYIAEYLADTSRLTIEQHGAYLLLIMDYWRNGPPPDSPEVLARIVGASAKQWEAIASGLLPMFLVSGGVWRHKRIDVELTKAKEISKIRSDAGAKGGAKHKAKEKQNNTPSPSPLPKDLKDLTPAPEPAPAPKSKGADAPDWMPPEWIEFEQHRKEKRQSLTPTARKRLIQKLDRWRGEGKDLAAIIRNSLDNGYTGLFEVIGGGHSKKSHDQVIEEAYRLTFPSTEKDVTDESERL